MKKKKEIKVPLGFNPGIKKFEPDLFKLKEIGENLEKRKVIERIMDKKEFSDLCFEDVLIAFEKFDNEKYSNKEKINLTRDLLHKVFGSFTGKKVLSSRKLHEKNREEILRKHLSTRERLGNYEKLYEKIFSFGDFKSVIDLGCGINGVSYEFFPESVSYLGIESVGQLVDLMNRYFKKNNYSCAKAMHESLFNLEKIKKIVKKENFPRVVFLFKVVDVLEIMERDYSKKLLSGLKKVMRNGDFFIVSFATESMIKRKRFKVNRKWFFDFLEKEKFNVIEDFTLGGERYLIIRI